MNRRCRWRCQHFDEEEVPVGYLHTPRSDIYPPSPSLHNISTVHQVADKRRPSPVPGLRPEYRTTPKPMHQPRGIGGLLVSVSPFFPSLRQVYVTFYASTWPKRMFSRALITLFFQTARSTQLVLWSVA